MSKYTTEYFLAKQAADPEIQAKVKLLQTSASKPLHLKRFELFDGVLLCYRIDKNKPVEVDNLALVVSKATITRVAADLHLLTHTGFHNLVRMLRRYYYHPELSRIAQIVSQGCETCLLCSLSLRPELPQGVLRLATRPGQILYCDFIVMRKTQHNGVRAKYILNIVDAFSMYTFAVPTSDMLAITILKVYRSVMPLIPGCEILVSDNQSSLITEAIVKFLASLGIKAKTTIAYSSKSNLAEISNKCVRRILRCYQNMTGNSWLAFLTQPSWL